MPESPKSPQIGAIVAASTESDEAPPATLRSLYRNRDFVLLFVGQVVSTIGSRVSLVAFPLLVLYETHSATRAGIASFCATLPYFVWNLPAGALTDRFDRKKILVVVDGARGLAFASLVAVLAMGGFNYFQVLVVAFIDGTGFVFFSLAEMAALPHIVPDSQLTLALSQNEARTRAGALIGQPLGGFLFGVSRSLPFLADAISYLASVCSLMLIRTQTQTARATRRMDRAIGEAVRFLLSQRLLVLITILVSISNFVVQGTMLSIVVLVLQRGGSSSDVGLIFGIMSAFTLVGSLVAPRLQSRLSPRSVILLSSWTWVAMLPLFVIKAPVLLFGLYFGLAASLLPVGNVIYARYELKLTPNELFGRLRSVIMLVAWGSLPLGALLAGLSLTHFGSRTTIFLLAGIMATVSLTATMSPALRQVPVLG